jgi:hypothetical protein
MRKIKCICSDIIAQKHDGQSKKMMQAQMLKAPKSYKLKYSNSAADNIVKIILANEFEPNKGLLLCYKFDRYSELISPFILKFPKIEILPLLDKIVLSLTTDQYNSVFNIKSNVPVPVMYDTQLIYKNKKTFYVITADLFGYNSFIFKNYTNDVFIPTYRYTFDLSDISNAEKRDPSDNTIIIKPASKLSFSIDKNWIPYTNLAYSGTPGTPGAYVLVTIPQSIKIGQLYVFNAADINVTINYMYWGYNIKKITVLLDSVKDSIIPLCKNIPSILEYQKIPDETINTIIDYNLICLPRSTVILIDNTFGANLYIDDVLNKRGIGYYNNNKYGMYSDLYYIYVPQKFELAFLNKNDPNFTYSGDAAKHSTFTIEGTEDTYDFYYGNITILIKGSFQPISIYTKKYGYLNFKDIIVYSETCSSVLKEENPYLIPY